MLEDVHPGSNETSKLTVVCLVVRSPRHCVCALMETVCSLLFSLLFQHQPALVAMNRDEQMVAVFRLELYVFAVHCLCMFIVQAGCLCLLLLDSSFVHLSWFVPRQCTQQP